MIILLVSQNHLPENQCYISGQSRERDDNSLCPGEMAAMVPPSFRERDDKSLCPCATLSGGVILHEKGRENGISNGNSKRPGS